MVGCELGAGGGGRGRSGSPLCDPDSVVQLHGAWHVLSALAVVVWADSLLADDR